MTNEERPGAESGELELEKATQPSEPDTEESDRVAEILLAGVVAQRFTGPLPPPDVLHGYEQVLPGAAERIVAMAEREQGHRHQVEDRVVKSEGRLGVVGLVFALLIALAVLGASVWLIRSGNSVEGTVLAAIVLVALATNFILGRRGSAHTGE